MQLPISRNKFLPQRRKGAKKNLRLLNFLCAFAPLREKSSVDLSKHNIQGTDDGNYIRDEVPDAHLSQRLKIDK